jgi:hypothetical protein
MSTLDEKLTYLAEFARGRIHFIPATKDEAAQIDYYSRSGRGSPENYPSVGFST